MSDSKQIKGMQTDYSNKIGLYSDKTESFISQINDVVISFPFKDCVLEAGMTKEDKKTREERFLLQKTDTSEIDTLFDEKVLTNFKLIDNSGEKVLSQDDDVQFFDEDGELKQNLLIKGNNLLALHSLKNRLAGKVKLIYIDPPYNTGSDSFTYNDNFNHSSWLVFMKNRLEIAKQLLRDDGAIFISISDEEYAYLKVLSDEVFSRENYIFSIVYKRHSGGGNDSKYIAVDHEYILIYAKNKGYISNFRITMTEEDKKLFKYEDEYINTLGKYKLKSFKRMRADDPRIGLQYDIIAPDGEILHDEWKWEEKKFLEGLKNNKVIIRKNSKNEWAIEYKIYEKENGEDKLKVPRSLWTDIAKNSDAKRHLKEILPASSFDNPKSEDLIFNIISTITEENDIILDYHLGSGTTCAVAHKMNRRYIGIEQMDYIEDISKVRLQKVIEGEQGGISKAVNWTGSGSFVYFELKKYNQEYVEQIMQANTKEELNEVYKQMQLNAFLQFWFEKKDFESEEGYKSLDLGTQKIKLLEILDENQLYLNTNEMHDIKHKVSDDEKVLTGRFYGETSGQI